MNDDDSLIGVDRFTWEQLLRRVQFPKGRGVHPRTLRAVAMTVGTYATFETGRDAFPGNKRLAAVVQLNERQIRRALEILVELGLLDLVEGHSSGGRGGGAGRAAEYRLTLPTDLSKLVLLDVKENGIQDPESLLPPIDPGPAPKESVDNSDKSVDIFDESVDIFDESVDMLVHPHIQTPHIQNSHLQGSPNVTVTSAREAESPFAVAARNDELAAVYQESMELLQDAPLCGRAYMEEIERTKPELTLTERVIAAADLFRMDLESARPAFRPEKRESA